jgi:hypothetical protein
MDGTLEKLMNILESRKKRHLKLTLARQIAIASARENDHLYGKT